MEAGRGASLMDTTTYYMFKVWDKHGDKTLVNMPMMNEGPWFFLTIALSFVFFIKVAGPNYMRDRKPMYLKPWMIFFNGLLFGGYGVFFVAALVFTKFGLEGLDCKSGLTDPNSTDVNSTVIKLMGYMYLIGKCGDFIVPVFRVLLKKTYSDLHILHTLFMVFTAYFGLVFYPGGVVMVAPFLDGLYYSVLYGYLSLTTPPGENYRPGQKWAKYLAILRIGVFALTMVQNTYFYFQPNCGPSTLKLLITCYAFLGVTLLTRDYKRRFPVSH
ncbi:Elongation of very long chain fatty acids protein 1 [Halotydeus destructor]|nr:Elongation of very long chain fatty acids protein 1 [Halotydeus destructor]